MRAIQPVPYLIGKRKGVKGLVCRDGVVLGRVSGRYRGASTTNRGRTGRFYTATVGKPELSSYGWREGPTLSTRCDSHWQAARLLIDFHRSYPGAVDADYATQTAMVRMYREDHGLTTGGKRHIIAA